MACFLYVGGCRYLKCDLETFDLRDLESKFDVILIEPPLEEYQRTLGVTYDKYWSWDMVSQSVSYRHCPHTMQCRVCIMARHPSICLFVPSSMAATAAGEFAAEHPAGRICRSIAAGVGAAYQPSIDTPLGCPCSAANAGSIMLRADRGGSTQTCFILQHSYITVLLLGLFV